MLALPYLDASYDSVFLTRPAWRPLSQRFIIRFILDRIYLARKMPNVLVSIS